MAEQSVPSINVLNSITPDNIATGGPRLIYESLGKTVLKFKKTSGARANAVWDSPLGSLDEYAAAWQLAAEGLVFTAEKVIEADDQTRHDMWADRFTKASIEIYGAPEAKETARLIAEEQGCLQSLRGKLGISQPHLEFLIATYEPLIDIAQWRFGSEVPPDEIEKIREHEALEAYGQAIRQHYQPMFELVEQSGKEVFNGTGLRRLFNQALEWLVENYDPKWAEWSIINGKGTSPMVSSGKKTIKIPDDNVLTKAENAAGLLVHELLGHALRSKNGFKLGKRFGEGLPGFSDIEEGIALLVEQAVSGKELLRPRDRYVDTALALGTLDGHQRTRLEVFEITFARWLLREQSRSDSGRSVSRLPLWLKAWNRVDRIYRGGRGDETGLRQAIFTKDASYYPQFKQALDYLIEEVDKGRSAAKVFDYINRAKSNPMNPKHVDEIEAVLGDT